MSVPARNKSARKTLRFALLALAALAIVLIAALYYVWEQGQQQGQQTEVEAAPPTPSPTLEALQSPAAELPEFPTEPPAASTTYVLPDALFERTPTFGDAVNAVLSALERAGYVERSFFGFHRDGVALVTRLERIQDDGAPDVGRRWPENVGPGPSEASLYDFLRGLFFVDPGRYRVIVFLFVSGPVRQSDQSVEGEQAVGWLKSGGDVLPPALAARPFRGAHCAVLVYEFASDGTKVREVGSGLTAKQHLEKAGVLTASGKFVGGG